MEEHASFSIWVLSAIIFATVVVAKIISKKTQTVDVLWLIIFGSILSNIGLLPQHNEALEYIGELGIIFIMFALGFEENLQNFIQGLRKAWGIALIGALFPFLAGYFTATAFGYSSGSALVWGLTMTATAVSLTMMTLRNRNMHKTKAATGIMTAAVVDDVLSLIGVAILIPVIIISHTGDVSEGANLATDIFIILAKVVAFFVIVIIVGLFGFPERVATINEQGLRASLVKIPEFVYKIAGIKKLLLVYKGEFTPLIVIFIAMSMGALAYVFGFHPAIGAYFAGLFLQEEYFLDDAKKVSKEFDEHIHYVKKFIDNVAFIIFGPIFFVNLGAKLVFDIEILGSVVTPILILFGLVFVFQILSASVAARFTGGYQWAESILIGFGMLGRAELAFIVINIAFVQHNIIGVEEFYILIFTTFLLNVSVPLTIKWWEPYYKGSKELKIGGVLLSKPKS